MFNINKFNKYLYVFIFSFFTLMVFIINYRAIDPRFLTGDSKTINFFIEINQSIKPFNFIYVALFIFILYFYNGIYFNDRKFDFKFKISLIVALLLSVLSIINESFLIDNTLNTIYSSYAQIFKSIILIVGYYLMYYAIIKKILSVKFDFMVKKKVKF